MLVIIRDTPASAPRLVHITLFTASHQEYPDCWPIIMVSVAYLVPTLMPSASSLNEVSEMRRSVTCNGTARATTLLSGHCPELPIVRPDLQLLLVPVAFNLLSRKLVSLSVDARITNLEHDT